MKATAYSKPGLVDMLSRPDDWQAWPFLPVKNKRKKGADGYSLLGLMIEGTYKVYDANLFDQDSLKADKIHGDYPTALAAEMDGWEVD